MKTYLKIHSDPVLIFHTIDISPADTGEDYLHYPILLSISNIRNSIDIQGGQENTNVDCQLDNTAFLDGVPICTALFGLNPPLKKKSEIINTELGTLFSGNVTRVKLSTECSIAIEG